MTATQIEPRKKPKTHEVAKVQETPVAVVQPKVDLSEWGIPQLTSQDVMIPKILVMQAMSKPVVSGEAKFGEFRDSLTGNILGDDKNPIEIVPFYMEKVFVVMEEEKGKFKFKTQTPIVPENEGHAYEVTTQEGKKQKWYRTLNFYVLLPNEVEEDRGIPYLLSFRSTSAKAGQRLSATMFMKNIQANKTPASTVMTLSCFKDSNTDGTYMVFDVKEKRDSTPKEVAKALEWVRTIKKGAVKVDHSDIEGAAGSATAAAAPESTEY